MDIDKARGTAMARSESVAPRLELPSEVDVSSKMLRFAYTATCVATAAGVLDFVREGGRDGFGVGRLLRRAVCEATGRGGDRGGRRSGAGLRGRGGASWFCLDGGVGGYDERKDRTGEGACSGRAVDMGC